MELWLPDGEIIKDVNFEVVIDALENLSTSNQNWFFLETEEGGFLEISASDKGGVQFNYSEEGSLSISQSVEPVNLDQAKQIVSDFINNHPGWEDALEWRIVDSAWLKVEKPLTGAFVKRFIAAPINYIFKIFSEKIKGIPGIIWLLAFMLPVFIYIDINPALSDVILVLDDDIEITARIIAIYIFIFVALWVMGSKNNQLRENLVPTRGLVVGMHILSDLGEIEKIRFVRVRYDIPSGTVTRWFRVTKVTMMNLCIGDEVKIKYHPKFVRMAAWVGGRVKHTICMVDTLQNVKSFKQELDKWNGRSEKIYRRASFRMGLLVGFVFAVYALVLDLLAAPPVHWILLLFFLGPFIKRFVLWSVIGVLAVKLVRAIIFREQRLRPYRENLGQFIRFEPVTNQNLVDCPFCSYPVQPTSWYCPYCGMPISIHFRVVYVAIFISALPVIALVAGNPVVALWKAIPLFIVIAYGLRDGLIWRRARRWH